MNRRIVRPALALLLPLAVRWVGAMERRVLREGVRLSPEEMAEARALGVREPERVRLFCFGARPGPRAFLLRHSITALRLFTPATSGIALRYGLCLRADRGRDRLLVRHELAHTAQYERLGGIAPFLRQYLSECLVLGYHHSPLEKEANHCAGRAGISEKSVLSSASPIPDV